MRVMTVLWWLVFMAPLAAMAQGTVPRDATGAEEVWVQIEAQPTLAEATARARDYARDLPDVNGFALGRGWYAIALGPYRAEDAARVLRVYRAERVIPRDSYIARRADYGRQFWPVGAAPEPPAPAAPLALGAEPAPQPEETLREAYAGEAALDRAARAALQEALQWAGVYDGAIDAAFGPGTRAAMAAWQRQMGVAPTGVLTTGQRAALMEQYTAVLAGLGLETVRDRDAGIEIALPLAVVALDRHDPPFVRYRATGDLPVEVLLISQPGDRTVLRALYDILQTLEIVPPNGPRGIDADGFTLVGEGRDRVSQTRVWLQEGEIKGYTLVWPTGDEARRMRVLQEMEQSFARLPGTLAPVAAPRDDPRIDLVAGLDIRRPRLARSGFYVDARGAVLTSAEAVRDCGRITLDEAHDADIARLDEALGVALLRPRVPLAPAQVAQFRADPPGVLTRIAVAGYSYGGRLGGATVSFGQVAALRGLDDEPHLHRLDLDAREGDTGGPVLDADGAVLGLLLPHDMPGRVLPDGVGFAAAAAPLRDGLIAGGVTPQVATARPALSPEALTDRATAMTVLVGCWD